MAAGGHHPNDALRRPQAGPALVGTEKNTETQDLFVGLNLFGLEVGFVWGVGTLKGLMNFEWLLEGCFFPEHLPFGFLERETKRLPIKLGTREGIQKATHFQTQTSSCAFLFCFRLVNFAYQATFALFFLRPLVDWGDLHLPLRPLPPCSSPFLFLPAFLPASLLCPLPLSSFLVPSFLPSFQRSSGSPTPKSRCAHPNSQEEAARRCVQQIQAWCEAGLAMGRASRAFGFRVVLRRSQKEKPPWRAMLSRLSLDSLSCFN